MKTLNVFARVECAFWIRAATAHVDPAVSDILWQYALPTSNLYRKHDGNSAVH